jgi:hypothetical protein
MPNHYHLLVETPAADLSTGMHWLNFRYAQGFNHRHALDGHLFQDRFYSVVVEGDGHLVELSRYLALNPVSAGLCHLPGEWTWGSYAAVAGSASPRRFLAVGRVLRFFGRDNTSARAAFRAFVNDSAGRPRT